MIRFDNVTKAFPDGTLAVAGLNLEMPSGKITVLVGPSGCGKTTSLRMINRMVQPSSGSILIDDHDSSLMNATELRRGIGYVIQQAGLFPNKTAIDNIAAVPRLLGWSRRAATARAHEMLETVGLPQTAADHYPRQLSGGQQQRVGVARALAADPPILLMDEPFSAVDPVVRTELQDELLRLQHDLAKTIVFVTHDIDEAIRIGDNIAVMRPGGHLAQFAPPETLLSAPADTFVAAFLGKDRGYRALGFNPAGELPLAEETTIAIGSSLRDTAGLYRNGWLLVVDEHQRPVGWLSSKRADDADAEATSRIGSEHLNLGGTLGSTNGTLRSALDAALSSPSRRGVIVDTDGHVAGTVKADELLATTQARSEKDHDDAVVSR